MGPELPAHAAHALWKDGKRQDPGSACSLPFALLHGHHLHDRTLCNGDRTTRLVTVLNARGPVIRKDKGSCGLAGRHPGVADGPGSVLVSVHFAVMMGGFPSNMQLVERNDRNKDGFPFHLPPL